MLNEQMNTHTSKLPNEKPEHIANPDYRLG